MERVINKEYHFRFKTQSNETIQGISIYSDFNSAKNDLAVLLLKYPNHSKVEFWCNTTTQEIFDYES